MSGRIVAVDPCEMETSVDANESARLKSRATSGSIATTDSRSRVRRAKPPHETE